MDNNGLPPKIVLEVPGEENGDENGEEEPMLRRRASSLSKIEAKNETPLFTKKKSFRKTLTRTWSKRLSFRSKSEIRSVPNTSPTKEEEKLLSATPSDEVELRMRGRSRERRAVSAGPSAPIVREKPAERPKTINILVTGTAEAAGLFPIDSRVSEEEKEKDKHSANNVEDGNDLEDIKHHLDPALLNGSSSNFGSAGARSAPCTPQTTTIGPLITGVTTESPPGASPPSSLPRSPSHNIFSKSDKGNIKQLSTSAPIMTAQAQSPEPPSPKGGKDTKPLHKGRQKKFHRHFPSAITDDVLNYYSCALIGDILLQGHLYITKNYFAFYSNVFGYVTKLLIPMQSVEQITKEKTARIIPNAVGIKTFEDKHVFGSLMSRDATYRYMNEVWETCKKELSDEIIIPSPPPSEGMDHNSDLSESSESREESGRESASDVTSRFRKCTNKPVEAYPQAETKAMEKAVEEKTSLFRETYLKFASASSQNMFLYVTTFLLIILFLSAAVLLYRIGQVQNRYTQALQDNFVLSDSDDVYGELLQWQTHLHSKSAGAVHSFLDSNLDQIAKVRQSLEALSTLLIPNGHGGHGTTAANPIDSDNS